MSANPPPAIGASLVASGLAGSVASLDFVALTGGVASDIWRVRGAHREIVVKRARARLAVAALWEVPVERNRYEAEFLRVTGDEVPGFAPALLAEDAELGLIVLPWLDPADWHLWKARLLEGTVDGAVAASVGTLLGRLARITRYRPDLARRFPTGELFEALRLDPYLRECARRHPDLAVPLIDLADATAARQECLVHGDVSPKNILVNRAGGPLILDAECAWYGDPAFDLAFVLNHLLLKCVHRPASAQALRDAITTLTDARSAADDPTEAPAVLTRAARPLPALMLARIDGKSPVEYLTDPAAVRLVRRVARRFILEPPDHPLALASALSEPHPE